MARPRKTDRHLPPCVYLRHGAYWHVVKGTWTKLGSDLPAALAEYARRIQRASVVDGQWARLVSDATGPLLASVAPSTREQYQSVLPIVVEAFIEFAPDQIRPVHVHQLMSGLKDRPGIANRVLSVLRRILDHAMDLELVSSNAARGARRLPQRPRDRLITQSEFAAIYEHAPPRLQIVMDLCYLTGQRIGDILSIRHEHIANDTIEFQQQKTGQKLRVHNPALADVVARARSLRGKVTSAYLLQGRGGKKADYKSVFDQWGRACKAAGVQDAWLHDLRAMAATAAKVQGLDPQKLAGHRAQATTLRYLRDKAPIAAEGPSFGQVLDIGQKNITGQ